MSQFVIGALIRNKASNSLSIAGAKTRQSLTQITGTHELNIAIVKTRSMRLLNNATEDFQIIIHKPK